MKNVRKIFYFLSIVFITVICCYGSVFTAFASPLYYQFEDISSIAVSDDETVAVANGDTITLIRQDGSTGNIDLSSTTSLIYFGEHFYALSQNMVFVLDEENLLATKVYGFDNISSIGSGDGLMCSVSDNKILIFDGEVFEEITLNDTACSVTVLNDKVYYTIKSGNYYSVYEANGSMVYNRLTCANVYGINGNLYGVDRYDRIVQIDGNGENVVFDDEPVYAFTANGSTIYYANEYNCVYRIDGNNRTLVAGSASNEKGFYNHPTAFIARMDFSAVCDYFNDRIEVTTGTDENISVSYFDVNAPTSLAIDNNGLIFVSHSSNKVTAFTRTGVPTSTEFTLPYAITKLSIGLDNKLYCLCSDKIYAQDGTDFTLVVENANAIYADNGLCFASGSKVFEINEPTTAIFDAGLPVIDFARDGAGNFFALLLNTNCVNLVKYETATATLTTVDSGLALGTNAIFISRTVVGAIAYGDILLVNSSANTVSFVLGETVGVDNTVPFTPTPTDYDEIDVIRSTVCNTYLYGSANESDILLQLPQNKTLLVLNYAIPAMNGMSYCACVDATGNLVFGFVFRSALSVPSEYLDPPSQSAIVYADNVNLYRLPSLNSDTLYSFSQDETLMLLPFCTYSDGVNLWYRAQANDGTVGYVPTYSVSVHNFIPNAPRPQYNAKIRSFNNSLFAICYEKLPDGTFVPISTEILLNDTQIEIVGEFDASVKYTQIKYFDSKLGTLTCYIETIYIEYNTISIVQIVAITVAIITAILMFALLLRVYLKRRKI